MLSKLLRQESSHPRRSTDQPRVSSLTTEQTVPNFPLFTMPPSSLSGDDDDVTQDGGSTARSPSPAGRLRPITSSNSPHPTDVKWVSSLLSPGRLTEQQLQERMVSAVAYTKGLLEDGDTLVLISYPGGGVLYDSSGFHFTSKDPRVNSAKLLDTGSPNFKKLLGDWKQHRVRRAKGMLAGLPSGVRFVLDLTPPYEGDEAIELLSELSCTPGIRNWYKAQQRLGIHPLMAGGDDEVTKPYDSKEPNSSLEDLDATVASTEYNTSNVERHAGLVTDSSVRASMAANLAPPPEDPARPTLARPAPFDDSCFDYAMKQSRVFINQGAIEHNQFDPTAKQRYLKEKEVLEYCPIRHRAGIVRLLQVIEGKDPRLDSAPKVWTLFVLAKHFNCTNVVVDYIVSWLRAEPNCQFIEILPEVTLKIGLGLKNSMITRAAFSILVSEQAMLVASRTNSNVPTSKIRTTRFQRVREDIDDDIINTIEAAADSFHDRIQKVMYDLVHPDLPWLESLPEIVKIRNFQSQHDDVPDYINDVEMLISLLRFFVRGRIVSLVPEELPPWLCRGGDEHRAAESYLKPYNGDFQEIWASLNDQERIMTKFFWWQVREINWVPNNYATNTLSSDGRFDVLGLKHQIPKVRMCDIQGAKNQVINIYNHFAPLDYSATGLDSDLAKIVLNSRYPASDSEIAPPSPLFSLARFFEQVANHIFNVTRQMLYNSEVEFRMITDTVLCLTDNEFKYLPLWAGGNEDGSGGVFNPDMPPAQLGATGPGPSYHTGFSTASQTSTEIDWDGTSDVGTSVMVDNGYSDHLDRRAVFSDDGFGEVSAKSSEKKPMTIPSQASAPKDTGVVKNTPHSQEERPYNLVIPAQLGFGETGYDLYRDSRIHGRKAYEASQPYIDEGARERDSMSLSPGSKAQRAWETREQYDAGRVADAKLAERQKNDFHGPGGTTDDSQTLKHEDARESKGWSPSPSNETQSTWYQFDAKIKEAMLAIRTKDNTKIPDSTEKDTRVPETANTSVASSANRVSPFYIVYDSLADSQSSITSDQNSIHVPEAEDDDDDDTATISGDIEEFFNVFESGDTDFDEDVANSSDDQWEVLGVI